jgi:tetratricopeptide (TPR) repeat protein/SAM-dependent methyltransferase
MVAVSDSLKRALKHHEVGELEQAEALYREIIRIDPGHVDALHLLGVAAHQRADHRGAADYIQRAIARGEPSPLYHSNLGACYRAMNRLPEAIAAFREAVQIDPRFVGARYNLAMSLEATGALEEAIDEYRKVLRIEPGYTGALNNLGSLLASRQRTDEAVDCFQQALKRNPNSAEFHYNLANTLARAGRCDEAIAEYRESIRLNPKLAETHNNLATALHAVGRHDEAFTELNDALALRPDYAEARLNLTAVEQRLRQKTEDKTAASEKTEIPIPLPVSVSAAQLCEQGSRLQFAGRLDEAPALFEWALRLDPNCAAAYFGLGYGLLLCNKHREAETYYEQGLLIDDTDGAAWNNLGSIYSALEQWDEAVACYHSALQINAANAKAHFNLGNVYKEREQLSEAAACYRRALYIDPALPEAHINLGVVVLQKDGRFEDAVASHSRAIQIRPHDPEAHFHRALTWLLMGDFERGWREYRWRWPYYTTPRDFSFPDWTGGVTEKTILLYSEQGIGDEIQFASCFPEVLERVAQCVIECNPRLVSLFARSFPLAQVVGKPLSIPAAQEFGVDQQIAAGSLPGLFRNHLEDFPKRPRFLAACPRRRAEWRERFTQLGDGLKVGISWRGGSKASSRRRRSTLLEQWKPVFSIPGVQFVNLQYGSCDAELDALRAACGATVHRWPDADPLNDLDGLAAQIAELDLVISVDNATVHMAGALGVPVWTLLHFAPNWRWMLGRGDSPWYPSMSLLRQCDYGNWDSVFDFASEHLSLLTTCRASKTVRARQAILHAQLASVGASGSDGSSHESPARISGVDDPFFDAQAAEERAKYERVWEFSDYRRYSPGASAIEQVGLIGMLHKFGVRTILDAGCGTGKLMWRLMTEHAGKFEVHGFDITDKCLDPCFEGMLDRVLTIGCLWDPHDFTTVYDAVICTDVMEHIPTDRVPAVLSNLKKSTGRLAYLSISVVPDSFGPKLIGEPLHLTVRPSSWWFEQLSTVGFRIVSHATANTGTGAEVQLHVFATV